MAISDKISASDIVEFAAREGNDFIESQVNLKAPLFAELDKVPMKGKRAIINVDAGGLASTKMIADYGDLPSEAAVQPEQGTVDAVGYVSVLGFGRIALATLAGVEDSVDLLDTQLQRAANDMARQIGRSVFDTSLGSPSAATLWSGAPATATVSFSGDAASSFRVGEAYHWNPDGYGADDSFTVLCTNVAFTGDTAVDVTFENSVPGISTLSTHEDSDLTGKNITTASTFHMRGKFVGTGDGATQTQVSGAVPVTLSDICGTATLHGLSGTARDWSGNSITSAGAVTAELMLRGAVRAHRRSGEMPSHLVLSPMAYAAYAAAQLTPSSAFGLGSGVVGQSRRNVDGKLDKYGRQGDLDSGGVQFLGRPVILDANCPESTAFLINKDHVKVGEWQKLRAEDEAGSPLLLGRSTFSKSVQFSCIYNLVCRKRNSHVKISGLTFT